jgi:hypothetical protein
MISMPIKEAIEVLYNWMDWEETNVPDLQLRAINTLIEVINKRSTPILWKYRRKYGTSINPAPWEFTHNEREISELTPACWEVVAFYPPLGK